MAILTKPSVLKGVVSQFSLSKTDLLNNSVVSNDPYFSDSDNWYRVNVIYKSSPGTQYEIVEFDATQETPVGNFLISERARDVFEVQKIRILDFDGGFLEIPRSDLTVADFDVSIGSSSSSSSLSTFTIMGDGTMTNENGVLTKTDDLGNAVVAYSDNFSSYPEDSTVEFEVNHIGSEYFVGMGVGVTPQTAQEIYAEYNTVFNLIVKSDGSLQARGFFGGPISLSETASVGDKFKLFHSNSNDAFYIYKNDVLIFENSGGGRSNDNPQSYPKRAIFSTVNQNTSVKDLNFKSS